VKVVRTDKVCLVDFIHADNFKTCGL
jgi:hypothetical protein